jgi:hypothetical protein
MEHAPGSIACRIRPRGFSVAAVVGLAFLLFPSGRLHAAEGGVTAYAPGSFASFIDALPTKPGLAVFDYFTFYKGSAGASRSLPIAGQIGVNVDATTYVNTVGAFWISPLAFLGGHYVIGAAIPVMWNTVSAGVTLPGGGSISRSDSANGLGDVQLYPIAMSWGGLGGDLHVSFFGTIYLPSGDFQKSRLANDGLGYWTFEPGLLASYLNQKNGIELSAFVAYDFNTANTTTDYHSGQVFHVDGTAAWHFLPVGKGAFGAGATGFYLQQTTGDTGSGARLGSFKVMTAGVGPVISYAAQFGKTGVAVSAKWLPQLGADNTLDGNYVWIKLAASF